MFTCEGCASASDPVKCGFTKSMAKHLDANSECSCDTCLIKMMCQTACEKHDKFWSFALWGPSVYDYKKKMESEYEKRL